jgi:hypothetical protein
MSKYRGKVDKLSQVALKHGDKAKKKQYTKTIRPASFALTRNAYGRRADMKSGI